MKKRVLGLLLAALLVLPPSALATDSDVDPVNTVPAADASFWTDLTQFLKAEIGDQFYEWFGLYGEAYVDSGGIHTTSVNLGATPSAMVAYPGGHRVTEDGSTQIAYTDSTTCWTIAHKDASGNVGSFTRVSGSHFLTNCSGSKPSLPTDSLWLMEVTTSAGAITAVKDLRRMSPDREPGVFKAVDYGAVCDGSTDNATAFQAAIDAAEDAFDDTLDIGTTVEFPAGHCPYGTGLTLSDSMYVNLRGAGPKQTFLDYTGGAGTGITLAGDASGDNKNWIFEGFQLYNTGSGTHGIVADFMGFSPVCRNVIVANFAGKQYDLQNFENGIFEGCRAELLTVGTHGFYIDNANNVRGTIQTHGQGDANGTDGSIGVYVSNIDAIDLNATIEGTAATSLDIGLFIDGSDTASGAQGGGQIIVYIEKAVTGVIVDNTLGGNDPDHVTISGKISGTITTGIKIDDSSRVKLENMWISASTTCINDTANAVDVDVGANVELDTCTTKMVGSSTIPTLHENSWDYTQPGGGNLLVDLDNKTANVSATNVDVLSMGHSDPRPPIAVDLSVRVVANTVGNADNIALKIGKNSTLGAATTQQVWVYRAALDTSDEVWQNVTVPVDPTGVIGYSITSSDWTNWDISVDFRQLGVMY